MTNKLKRVDIDFIDFLYKNEINDSDNITRILSEAIDPASIADNVDIRLIGPDYPGFDEKYMNPHVFIMAANNSIDFESMLYNDTDEDEAIWKSILNIANKLGGRYTSSHNILNEPGFIFEDRSKAVTFVSALRSLSSAEEQQGQMSQEVESNTNQAHRVLDTEFDPGVVANGLAISLVNVNGALAAMWGWGEENSRGKWLYISADSMAADINPWEVVEFISKHEPEVSGRLSGLEFKNEDPDMSVPNMNSTLDYISIISTDGLLLGKNKHTWSHLFE